MFLPGTRRGYIPVGSVATSSAIAPALLYLLHPCSRVSYGPGSNPPPQHWIRPSKAGSSKEELLYVRIATSKPRGCCTSLPDRARQEVEPELTWMCSWRVRKGGTASPWRPRSTHQFSFFTLSLHQPTNLLTITRQLPMNQRNRNHSLCIHLPEKFRKLNSFS